MIRRGKHACVNHERWLVSYADFITLLFAFFVVLYASGRSDKAKQQRIATSIQSAFNQMGIFEAHSRLPPLLDVQGRVGDQAQPPPSIPSPAAQKMALFERRLGEVARQEIQNGTIGLHESAAGLTISLEEAGFFDSGSADLRPSAVPVLERIAATLPETGLRIEGHTDNVPIRSAQFASNWELSSARASSVARLLLRYPNVRPEEMSVAGYAQYHPIASNATPEGRARNRRVDIVVLNSAR